MSKAAIAARVWPADLSLFARAPVKCAASREQYFGLVELHAGVVTMLGPCALRAGKPPMCLPLPQAVRRFATAPGFVCPGCGCAGGGLFIPATEPRGDLLHSCFAPYRRGACGCGVYGGRSFVDCLPSPSYQVRGELVGSAERMEGPAPPGLSMRVQPGGGN
jgi:hypothetical protein